jgi:uncharacterized protein (DUF1778 family)
MRRSKLPQPPPASTVADVNIHLRALAQDRNPIDQAAYIVEVSRSQFMLASALKDAKNVLLDQTTILADVKTFQKVMHWMGRPATRAETAGMCRLRDGQAHWPPG